MFTRNIIELNSNNYLPRMQANNNIDSTGTELLHPIQREQNDDCEGSSDEVYEENPFACMFLYISLIKIYILS